MAFQLSNVVSATVTSFIDYALIIVTIMIAWYVVKFFMAAPPTKAEKEAALEEQREVWGGAIKKVKDSREAKHKEAAAKEYKLSLCNHSRTVINNLKHAFEAADKAVVALDRQDPATAIRRAKEFDAELHRAWGNLRLLRTKAKDEDKEKVKQITASIEANRHDLVNQVTGKIPRKVDANWNGQVTPIRAALIHIRSSAGAIFNLIDELAE